MQDHPSAVVHFVKLIDTAYATVWEDQGTTLEDELLGLWVTSDVNSKTHCWTSFARGVDTSGSDFVHILQQLRFGGWRVSTQKNIDFTSEPSSTTVLELFRNSTKKLTEYSLFDVLILPNAWC